MLKLNKKAFTLIEVLILLAVLAIVSVTAFFTYTQAVNSFGFLAEYKKTFSIIRTARSYALTNKEVGGELRDRYGVSILEKGEKWVVELLAQSDTGVSVIRSENFDGDKFDFAFCKADVEQCDDASEGNAFDKPISLWYEQGSGNFSMEQGEGDSLAAIGDSLAILFSKPGLEDAKKYIVVFKISGLAAEYKYPLPWGVEAETTGAEEVE